MTPRLMPVVFEPILLPKPWGGRRLEQLFGKRLPPETLVGESWELSGLPQMLSRVGRGPLAGWTVAALAESWGAALLGQARMENGRFPVLIKFLDISDALSVQVHPKPALPDGALNPDAKHEAWFIVHAEDGARLQIGLRDGVTAAALQAAGPSAALLDLLRVWPARRHQCYYLPSGTPHACGAGVVALEVQTPSDVTYRMYDWDRLGLDGRPRELHFGESLRHIRFDITAETICPDARDRRNGPAAASQTLVDCEAFTMWLRRGPGSLYDYDSPGRLRAWVGLSGRAELHSAIGGGLAVSAGDVAMVPAALRGLRVEAPPECEWVEVAVPGQAPSP